MKLYLLTRLNGIRYDEFDAMLIRAKSELEARIIANTDVGDEGQIWKRTELVCCKEILAEGKSERIITSFNAG